MNGAGSELDRVKALASQHPEWKTREPFASLLEGDFGTTLAGGDHALLEILMATHAGMTTVEFGRIAEEWIATATHPKTGRRFTEIARHWACPRPRSGPSRRRFTSRRRAPAGPS
jgi:hypothetical protein